MQPGFNECLLGGIFRQARITCHAVNRRINSRVVVHDQFAKCFTIALLGARDQSGFALLLVI